MSEQDGLDAHWEEFMRGVDEFNHASFFEAHDTWEEVWSEVKGVDREFIHGLINTAIGLHHLNFRRWKGAGSQLEKALIRLHPYTPSYWSIDVAGVIAAVKQLKRISDELTRGLEEAAQRPLIESITFPRVLFLANPFGKDIDQVAFRRYQILFERERVALYEKLEHLSLESDKWKEAFTKSEQDVGKLKDEMLLVKKSRSRLMALSFGLAIVLIIAVMKLSL